jgi:SAM-dependent methyltransferase
VPRVPDPYTEVPYPGLAFPQTHPDRLALLATLHGLDPAPPDGARVLEAGCADGLNLVAMACHSPGLTAVGFDVVEPELGRAAAAELGLANVRLERADLLDVRDWGEFDYVVAHGVYAWVPDAVRDALMALFARALAPQGVAFVSYNALPGARLRTMLREMALLHAGDDVGIALRLERARELYEFLAPWSRDRPDAYGAVLASELGRLRRLPTAVLAHDDLGERYEPVWLSDVAAHAARHGLRYLADAEPAELLADRQPPGVDEELDAIAGGDRVVWEQYADMLAGRAFRQTLLCRTGAPVDDAIDPARLSRLWFRATESAGIGTAGEEDGTPGPDGTSGNGSSGSGAVARLALARPRSLPFGELLGGAHADALAAELWRAFRAGEVQLSSAPDRHVAAAGERPDASPIARWQAARGPELTSLSHDPVRLDDPLGRLLIRLCDGTRDRAALTEALVAAVGTELQLTIDGEPVLDGERVRGQLAAGLERNLEILAQLAMLRA